MKLVRLGHTLLDVVSKRTASGDVSGFFIDEQDSLFVVTNCHVSR